MVNSYQTRGFTLVEILVAVTVFSILILTVFSAFQSFLSSGQAIKYQLAVDMAVGPCLDQITRDVEQVFISLPPRYQVPAMGTPPDPHRLDGGEDLSVGPGFSRIEFSSLNHARIGPDQRRGVARIGYYVRPNSQQGYDLCRSDRLKSLNPDDNSCHDPVLLRHVTGFEIRFTDASGNEYHHWDSESVQFGYAFPALLDIKLTLVRDHSSHIIAHLIRIPVRREIKE